MSQVERSVKRPAVARKGKLAVWQARASDPSDPSGPDVEIRVGIRLKHARLHKGLTLKQVANAVACSESTISKIETDKLRPSTFMLHRIARVLETNVAALFSETAPGLGPVYIVRANQRPAIRVEPEWQGHGIWLERVIPLAKGGLLQAHVLNVSPGGRSDGVIQHPGEDFGFVITGQLDLEVDGVGYQLSAGDCFFFPSSMAHGYGNSGKGLTRILWLNTPPTF